MAFTYRNSNGVTYTLHRKTDRRGRTRYVMKRVADEGAIDELPPGHEVRETPNGTVSIALAVPQQILAGEIQSVRAVLQSHEQAVSCRVQARGSEIIVHALLSPVGSGDELERLLTLIGGSRAAEILKRNERYQPVFRFKLENQRTRKFLAYRMSYRGEGGWHMLGVGTLQQLAEQLLPHIGRESFYELI